MPRRLIYLLPVIIGLVLGALVAAGIYADQERFTQKKRLEVFYKLANVRNSLESSLNARLQLASSLKAFISLNPDIDQESFANLARQLVSGSTGIRYVELARNNVVTHVYPQQQEATVLGHDLQNDFPLNIRQLVMRAMESRHSQILPPSEVMEGGKAIVIATPVHLGARPDGSERYWGLILMLIDSNTLYRHAGLGQTDLSLEMALMEPGTMPGQTTLLYGKRHVFARKPVIMNIPIPDNFWKLAAVPRGGWPRSPNRQVILFGGGAAALGFTALIAGIIHLLMMRIRSREQYRYLIKNARSIILRINLDGFISYANEYAEEFYGFEPGELIGKPLLGTLIPEKNIDGESMKRYVNKLLHSPSSDLFNETVNTRKNGELVWVSWANEPVLARDGTMVELLSVGTDVTDRKLMEEAVRNSERQHRLLAENVTDIILGLDADKRFTFISPSDETLRGFGRHEVLGLPIADFLTPPSGRLLDQTVDTLVTEIDPSRKPPATTVDLEFTCADGSTVWLETKLGLLLNEDGDLIGLQGVARDISDRKQSEALRNDVERMARHDLKTPLNAVIGLPDEIRRLGHITASQDAMLATIENAGNTMLEQINRSLDLFKMECGTYELAKESVDALQVLESIKDESRAIAREKGISVGIEVQDAPQATFFRVQAEASLFRSMLSNLILNALQASPKGGSVIVSLNRSDHIAITIRNRGEVPDAIRETFFEKYISAENGTGLGTYSARLIARTHGGDITLDTGTADETYVTVALPLE